MRSPITDLKYRRTRDGEGGKRQYVLVLKNPKRDKQLSLFTELNEEEKKIATWYIKLNEVR